VKLTISGDGEAWKQLGSETLFTALTPSSSDVKDGGLEVLSAFFVANHHGGDIGLIAKGAQPRIELTLPNDPLAAERPPTNPNFLDDVFDMFELQQLNSQTSPQ
ncbi:MAG: hypothetical protein KDB29_01280, partial [Planctomycetes bacterium]|nr:hypothetical protein [Planctomycetota bacterium]